jgi:SAM-dependent methyltransferase
VSNILRFRETRDKRYLRLHYNSPGYLRAHATVTPRLAAKFEALVEEMGPVANQKVLDIGCATGHFGPYVLSRGGIYVGVDIAQSFGPSTVADAEQLCFARSAFDWVVMADVLEHLPNPRLTILEAARVGRYSIAVIPNWYRLDRLEWLPHSPYDRHITRLSPGNWLKLFKDSDFEIISLRGFYYVPSVAFYPWLPLRAVEKLLHTWPLIQLGQMIEKRYAKHPTLQFMGQELIIVGKSTIHNV